MGRVVGGPAAGRGRATVGAYLCDSRRVEHSEQQHTPSHLPEWVKRLPGPHVRHHDVRLLGLALWASQSRAALHPPWVLQGVDPLIEHLLSGAQLATNMQR